MIFRTSMRIASAVLLISSLIAGAFAWRSPASAESALAQFARPEAVSTGSTSGPIFEAINNGKGPGLQGVSAKGDGTIGQTKFSSSNSPTGKAGVLGEDTTNTGFDKNAGVEGTSNNGTGVIGATSAQGSGQAGIVGQDLYPGQISSNVGVVGQSTNGTGVRGSTASCDVCEIQAGVLGQDTGSANYGVEGTSIEGYGVRGVLSDPASFGYLSAVQGTDTSPPINSLLTFFNSGVSGTSTNNIGVLGESTNNFAFWGIGLGGMVLQTSDGDGADIFSTNGTGLDVDASGSYPSGQAAYGIIVGSAGEGLDVTAHGVGARIEGKDNGLIVQDDDSTPGDFAAFLVNNSRTSQSTCQMPNTTVPILSLDEVGNLTICGTLIQSGQPLIKTGTKTGIPLAAYAARTTQPAIEDFGEAELVDGYAQVAIDRAFASTIDRSRSYLVFITPDGETRGLYVASRSAAGFVVRETQGGRSTLAFDYRIVAKPYDTDLPRLAPARDLVRFAQARPMRVPPSPHRPDMRAMSRRIAPSFKHKYGLRAHQGF